MANGLKGRAIKNMYFRKAKMSAAGHTLHPPELSLEQKRQLYRDGYILIKGAVSKRATKAARKRIEAAKPGENLAAEKKLTDLLNASQLTPIMESLFGAFDPPKLCQVAVNPLRKPGNNFEALGYRDKDLPYYGAIMHMDGICTIMSGIPQTNANDAASPVTGMSTDEKYRYYINAGQDPRISGKTKLNEGKTSSTVKHGHPELGRSCEVVGENGGAPLFNDPDCTLGIGSFTAFAFVALNDQTRPGCGQTAVVPGAHLKAEEFYRWQSDQGGIIGVEGPGWDRINPNAANGLGLNYLPQPILDEYTDESKYGPLERTPDGRVWPRANQVFMEEGDACITVSHAPHTATRNENGTESRKNIIFRIRCTAHNPNIIVTGVTDHIDRGQWGEWIDPSKPFHAIQNPVSTSAKTEWIDPFERSKYLLCHPWTVWSGMRDVVREEEAKMVASGTLDSFKARL